MYAQFRIRFLIADPVLRSCLFERALQARKLTVKLIQSLSDAHQTLTICHAVTAFSFKYDNLMALKEVTSEQLGYVIVDAEQVDAASLANLFCVLCATNIKLKLTGLSEAKRQEMYYYMAKGRAIAPEELKQADPFENIVLSGDVTCDDINYLINYLAPWVRIDVQGCSALSAADLYRLQQDHQSLTFVLSADQEASLASYGAIKRIMYGIEHNDLASLRDCLNVADSLDIFECRFVKLVGGLRMFDHGVVTQKLVANVHFSGVTVFDQDVITLLNYCNGIAVQIGDAMYSLSVKVNKVNCDSGVVPGKVRVIG